MKTQTIILLTLLLLLGACRPADSPPNSTGTGAAAEGPLPPLATGPGRAATFTEILNQVEARASQDAAFAPASLGLVLQIGGEARTGDNGKARLDLLPEGTIIRLAPNTIFAMAELSGDDASPSTSIELFFGKVWILLRGGALEVKTPSGVATVRGSLLGVSYNPETNALTATCLEGHCTLNDEDESIELTDGQAADIFDGDLSDEPRAMTEEELAEWQEEAPEWDDFLDEWPDDPGADEDPGTGQDEEAPPEDGSGTGG